MTVIALVSFAPGSRARAATALLSERNQSSIHSWDSANPGVTSLFHATQCNDVDVNVPEGSDRGWIGEHFSDYFARFVLGGNGLDAQYNLGQNGLTHYHYPKHVMVYNDEVVVMSRNDATIWRYSTDGAQIGSVPTGNARSPTQTPTRRFIAASVPSSVSLAGANRSSSSMSPRSSCPASASSPSGCPNPTTIL